MFTACKKVDEDEQFRVDELKESPKFGSKSQEPALCDFCNQGIHLLEDCWAYIKITRLKLKSEDESEALRAWRLIIDFEKEHDLTPTDTLHPRQLINEFLQKALRRKQFL